MPRSPLLPCAALGSLALGSAILWGCGEPPKLHGTVQDVWGHPVSGATVTVEGVVEQQSTDGAGAFSLVVPAAPMRVLAGKEGYIPATTRVSPLAEGQDPETAPVVTLMLYPNPDHMGFYAVGRQKYHELDAFDVHTIGTQVRALTGVTDIGEAHITQDGPLTFVFSTKLRIERLAQLDLQLHRLQFISESTLPGVLGETATDINLWAAAGPEIPYDLVVMPSRDDFLIKLREPLPKGAYAFDTQGALTNHSYAGLDKLPKELRVAYVFEVP